MLVPWLAGAIVLAGVIAVPHPAAASTGSPGGVLLDAHGGLHAFGGLSLNTSHAASWSGDVARSLAVLPDGSGGWTLDEHGGTHAFGAAGALSGTPWWPGDEARALVVLPDGSSGYELDAWGGLHPFGGAPALHGAPYWPGRDIARGLDIHLDSGGTPDGGATLDGYGNLHVFGTYPYSLSGGNVHPGRLAFAALHDAGGHVYAVGRFGGVVEETAGAAMSPAWSGYKDFGADDLVRDVVLTSASGGGGAQPVSPMAAVAWQAAIGPRGGVTLDDLGGVHPFGGMSLDHTGATYWPHSDSARALAILPDGSGGWTLDAWGATHPFGAAPKLSGTPYWYGIDAARSLVVNPDGHSGYELDLWGGLHPFGGAPVLHGAPYWRGWDVARGLAIHYTPGGTPDGGWVLDGWGGVHTFGAAFALGSPQYWPGRSLYTHLHLTGGRPYVVGRFGTFADISGTNMQPWWSGYGDWGNNDVIRDVVLFGADDVGGAAQPQSSGAVQGWWAHIWVWSFRVSPVQQGLPLDCESAALEEATRAVGHDVSQYTIFGDLPNGDKGPATWSNGRIVSWGDPYTEFVGNVYGSEPRGTGYGVYDPPLVAVARRLGFTATGIEKGSANIVFTDLALGHPVLVITSDTFSPVPTYWWTATDGRSVPYSLYDHAVTVVAENGVAGTVTLNDVADGRMKTFTMGQFADFWQTYLDMAVVLQ